MAGSCAKAKEGPRRGGGQSCKRCQHVSSPHFMGLELTLPQCRWLGGLPETTPSTCSSLLPALVWGHWSQTGPDPTPGADCGQSRRCWAGTRTSRNQGHLRAGKTTLGGGHGRGPGHLKDIPTYILHKRENSVRFAGCSGGGWEWEAPLEMWLLPLSSQRTGLWETQIRGSSPVAPRRAATRLAK